MAGMPPGVLERANEMLEQLESSQGRKGDAGSRIPDPGLKKKSGIRHPASENKESDFQLSFIQLDDPLLEQIKQDILNTEINTLTPVEALMKLNEIKKLLEKK